MKDLWVYGGYEWWNLGIKERAFEPGMSDCRQLGIDGGVYQRSIGIQKTRELEFPGTTGPMTCTILKPNPNGKHRPAQHEGSFLQ